MIANHYKRPQGTLVYYDTTLAQNIADGVDKVITNRDILEKQIVKEIYPSDYHSFLGDRGPHLRGDTALPFAEWCSTSKEDQSIEYVEPVQSLMYVMPTEGRSVFYNKGGLRMAEAGGIINFRDAPIYAHKAHDLMKHGEDFMASPVGYESAIEHSDLLNKAPNIDWIVIGKIPDSPGAIYGVAQLSKDSALLFGNVDSYKMIDKWARHEGIDTDAFILRAMGEEFFHLVRRGVAGVKEEEAVRVWLIDMYNILAEKAFDAETKGKYQRMISALEKDLATVRQRYSYSRNVEGLVDMYMSDPSKLELILEAEARLEYGLSEDVDVKDYVESRLEEISGAAENASENYDVADLDAELTEYAGEAAESDDGEVTEGEVCATTEDGGEAGDGGEGAE